MGDRLLIGHNPPDGKGEVVCRTRLGRMLRHDERKAA